MCCMLTSRVETARSLAAIPGWCAITPRNASKRTVAGVFSRLILPTQEFNQGAVHLLGVGPVNGVWTALDDHKPCVLDER